MLLIHYLFIFKQKRKYATSLFNKLFPHYYVLSEIYGRDRATRTNARNANDDEEEVRLDDNISVNLGVESNNVDFGGESNNQAIMEGFNNDMSYTTQTNATSHQQVDYAPSSSGNRSRKMKNKNKLFDHMCSRIGTMADSVATMVPNIDGLITALSSDREIADLQGKLYREMSKIEAWLMRKYMTALVCSPQNMICSGVLYLTRSPQEMCCKLVCSPRNMICSMCYLPYPITSRKDMCCKCFVVGCSPMLVMMLKLCIYAAFEILNL